MTVIAWDGKTLAAEKMSCSAGYGYTVTKVHRLKDGSIAAFSGDGDGAMALLHWLNGDRAESAYPAAQKDNDTSAFVVRPDRVAVSFGKTPHPQVMEDRFYAMGHGRDYALAALYCGKSAREAVELTCKLDVFCGNGIDSLDLQ
jgi:ATP-dependent protease HslVU (ClpYQ) peptidase subunit